MGTLPAYELKKLSDNDCLAVFAQHSLGTRDFSSHMSLEEISKKIVTKCDGLPLAAQALGGLLRGERDRGEWERVLSSKIWELQEEGCRIIPALAVSYYYLRPTLKQCFAYCSLLPKDYEFEEEEIILLWCASGFLDQKEREKTGEDLDMGNLAKLHHLKNSNTKSLEEMAVGIGRLTCLQTLCNFVVGKGPKGSGSGLRELKLLTHLHGTLNISKLENVKCVGTFPEHLPALEKLVIKGCEELSVSVSSLPALCKLQIGGCKEVVWRSATDNLGSQNSELKKIEISGCDALKSLPEAWMCDTNSSLEILEIWVCHSLTYIAGVQLPPSLKQLRISDCDNIRTLTVEEGIQSSSSSRSGLHNLRQLQEIEIWECENLVSFPVGGLPCAKLSKLRIYGCERLEALPKGLHNLTSLQQLKIGKGVELPSLEEDGLPTNLHSLDIRGNMEIWKSMIERGRGFHRFSSLRYLLISGCDDDMVSFPLEDKRLGTALPLPASLTTLRIEDFPNLERLSSSIVDLQNLTELILWGCPKLKYFPEKGLPSSLLKLWIYDCPLIEEKCRKDGGQYWDLLTHIPYVLINLACIMCW
ncbi:hypothetical protein CUMW_259730 [Citrus unshiu]|nr:hypothetical protein CUMW_259730 [Citrus unshiu]